MDSDIDNDEDERTVERLREDLFEATADLVTDNLEMFLPALFRNPPGSWLPVVETCIQTGVVSAAERKSSLEKRISVDLREDLTYSVFVTWLDSPTDEGFAVVLFYSEPFFFHNVAKVNLDYFREELGM